MKDTTLVNAMRDAFIEEMRRDEKVFIIGESILGAGYGITLGLVEEFGEDRIMDAPIAESAIAGATIGSALLGYRPVFDLMFADFMYVCADELLLKAAQWRFIQGGTQTMPAVFFGAVGGGASLANEHSKVPLSLVLRSPGLKLVYPSTPYDAKGLLKTAIRDDNPVVFFYHKLMIAHKGPVPEEEYTIPFGVADVKREGSDVTVVASGMMVNYALKVAGELEDSVSVEVIDPRTFEPFDFDTVLKSVEKTGRLLIVDEDTERCGFAGELGMQVVEKGWDLLDAPIKRVCAANYPIPGGPLESFVLPSPEKIKTAIHELGG